VLHAVARERIEEVRVHCASPFTDADRGPARPVHPGRPAHRRRARRPHRGGD
jgi:hypothetical protein